MDESDIQGGSGRTRSAWASDAPRREAGGMAYAVAGTAWPQWGPVFTRAGLFALVMGAMYTAVQHLVGRERAGEEMLAMLVPVLLIWVVGFVGWPILRAHQAGAPTRYEVVDGVLRGRGPHQAVAELPVASLYNVSFDDQPAGFTGWRTYAPALQATYLSPRGADVLEFPPIAVWSPAARGRVEQELRRACGLPADAER